MRSDLVGVLVLAAGASTRMGTPKQLLRYRGKTLVRAAAEAALDTGGPVVVVTGSEHEQVSAEISGLPVRVAFNGLWERGMGTSIRQGITEMLAIAPGLEAVLITLCDQPRASANVLRRILEARHASQKGLCAASFDSAIGPPVLMTRKYFEELLAIADTAGAKQVLAVHPEDVCQVPCPEAGFDVDTPADYEELGGGAAETHAKRLGHGH